MVKVNSLVDSISLHCWSPDRSLIAICPNNNEIWVYETLGELDSAKWKRRDVIHAHTMKITGLDWSVNNKILSCSEDATALVWSYENSQWISEKSELNIRTAALCCKWSPDGLRFALGYKSKEVCICYYDEVQHLWVRAVSYTKDTNKSKKQETCSQLCLSWHPSNALLAIGYVDGHVTVVNTMTPELAASRVVCPLPVQPEHCLHVCMNIDDCTSPVDSILFDTNQLFWSAHNSTINVLTFVGTQTQKQVLFAPSLPYTTLCLLNSRLLLAAGYDNVPHIFAQSVGQWKYIGPLDRALAIPPPPPPPPSKTVGMRAGELSMKSRMMMFQTSTIEPKKVVDPNENKIHKNVITCLSPVYQDNAAVSHVSTSSLDGRVYIWDIKKCIKPFKEIQL